MNSNDYISNSVKEIIEEYGTNDPYRIADELGIVVDEFPFRRIKGMVIKIAEKVTVVLNSNIPEWMKRFILAHELGHHELSPQGIGYFFLTEHTLMETKAEYEANRFAVELLTFSCEPEPGETLERFAARFGVPKDLLARFKAFK